MGYDINRFVTKVDEDFICPICTMVLENGVQSQHCEHSYCDSCIKQWLNINKICPIDRNQLSLEEIKPIPIALNNLILKLEIKCDFEEYGCEADIKLENLETHLNSCLYNPNIIITCDKDCGLEMTQIEYKSHNCFRKLASIVIAQQKQISLLSSELHDIRRKQEWKSDNGLVVAHNTIECVNTNFGEQPIGIAQYTNPLTEYNPYIEIKIIEMGNKDLYLGLDVCRLQLNDSKKCKRMIYKGNSGLAYIRSGGLHKTSADKPLEVETVPKWEVNDRIGCGIKYENSSTNAVVYFTRNKITVFEKSVIVCELGLYPTFYTNSVGTKVITNLV